MQYIVYFLVAAIALFVLIKIFTLPFKILGKLILNGILGVVLLIIVNFFGAYVNIYIPINITTALISGFFGIPGVIFLIIFKLIL